jgi:excisionase family DNA binding protein
MDTEILTTGDAARRSGFSGEYLRRLTREGKLAATRTVSGQYLFEAGEIERFIAERKVRRQKYSCGQVGSDY